MECRKGCGACCIAPSISSPIPGMPSGKPAGIPCVNLSYNMECLIFTKPTRPLVCAQFKAEKEVCGDSREEALANLISLEG